MGTKDFYKAEAVREILSRMSENPDFYDFVLDEDLSTSDEDIAERLLNYFRVHPLHLISACTPAELMMIAGAKVMAEFVSEMAKDMPAYALLRLERPEVTLDNLWLTQQILDTFSAYMQGCREICEPRGESIPLELGAIIDETSAKIKAFYSELELEEIQRLRQREQ